MNYLRPLLAFSILLLGVTSCTVDDCEQTTTYIRAEAIYADLSTLRVDDIISAPRVSVETPGKIFINDELILIGETGEGIHVFDNKDPNNPIPISFLEIPGHYEMYVQDDYIYSTAHYDLLKIDISDPQAIRLADRQEEAMPVKYWDNTGRALVGFDKTEETLVGSCDQSIYDDGQTVWFDFRGALLDESAIPTSFVSNGSTIGTANRMAVVDNVLLLVDRSDIHTYDITGDRVSLHADYHTPMSIGWNLETIYTVDDQIYLGSQNGMDIYRLESNDIIHQGSFWHATGCDPVLPTKANVAYLTLRSGNECPGDENALLVLDISQPFSIGQIQQVEMQEPYGMSIIGDKLFVGEGAYGLATFDISDPRSIRMVDYHDGLPAYDVIAHPTIDGLILIASAEGLRQYQVDGADWVALSSISF